MPFGWPHQRSPGLTATGIGLMLLCLTFYQWCVECHKVAYWHGTLLIQYLRKQCTSSHWDIAQPCATLMTRKKFTPLWVLDNYVLYSRGISCYWGYKLMITYLQRIHDWCLRTISSLFSAVDRWFVNHWTFKFLFLGKEPSPMDSVKDLGRGDIWSYILTFDSHISAVTASNAFIS